MISPLFLHQAQKKSPQTSADGSAISIKIIYCFISSPRTKPQKWLGIFRSESATESTKLAQTGALPEQG